MTIQPREIPGIRIINSPGDCHLVEAYNTIEIHTRSNEVDIEISAPFIRDGQLSKLIVRPPGALNSFFLEVTFKNSGVKGLWGLPREGRIGVRLSHEPDIQDLTSLRPVNWFTVNGGSLKSLKGLQLVNSMADVGLFTDQLPDLADLLSMEWRFLRLRYNSDLPLLRFIGRRVSGIITTGLSGNDLHPSLAIINEANRKIRTGEYGFNRGLLWAQSQLISQDYAGNAKL